MLIIVENPAFCSPVIAQSALEISSEIPRAVITLPAAGREIPPETMNPIAKSKGMTKSSDQNVVPKSQAQNTTLKLF